MAYWLMKSEPDVYSIDHLRSEKRKTDHWDGIRNYQARNFMRDQMRKGDLAFFQRHIPTILHLMRVRSTSMLAAMPKTRGGSWWTSSSKKSSSSR